MVPAAELGSLMAIGGLWGGQMGAVRGFSSLSRVSQDPKSTAYNPQCSDNLCECDPET